MANLKRLAYKIQSALSQNGRYIKINQRQYFSEKQGKFCTIYTVVENINNKNTVYCESGSIADVVKTLADILNGGE